MREVTDATFEREVLGASGAVLVDFWAPWCAPCRAVPPILEQLESSSGGRLALAKVNVDKSPTTATRYGVLALPTVILFEHGEPHATVVGARQRKHFEQAFSAWLDTVA